ncbi:MAG TPA: alpha/beta hydrolase [Halobacteriales archaeon]|nr:alpha/beta hydrolase [Halobacteriales archaeon]
MPTVPTNGIETYYERRGDGPPIVFVHGAVVDHDQWTPQLESLSDEYTLVAYDVRGHGRTGGSTTDPYSIELFAEDLDALLDALDVERPVLCGLSMGGCIAQVYAARHPDRIAGLVLADTFTPDMTRWDERLQLALLRATVVPARLVGYERVERAMVWLNERLRTGVSGDYERIRQLRAAGSRVETDEFAKVVRAVADFSRTSVDYSAISVPTLVLYGENDVPFVRRHAVTLGDAIPNATVRTVPRAGHASNLDNPAFFDSVLERFVAQAVLSRAEAR